MVGGHEAKEWAQAHLTGLFASPPVPFTPGFALDEARRAGWDALGIEVTAGVST